MCWYAKERGLPAVVMCVGTPYGPRDWQPSQGMFVQMSAFGRMPLYLSRTVGAKPPRLGLPLPALYAVGYCLSAASRLLRRDFALNLTGVRLLHLTTQLDHGKAMRELGWKPRPTVESIRRAAQWYVDHAARQAGTSDS